MKRGRIVHGVERISEKSIDIARSRLSSARVVDASETAPFAHEELDGLILADVIEHMPQAWTMLAHFAQCVRPGGWVIISVPNMRNIKVLVEFGLLGDWPERRTGIYDSTHVQVMSRKRLRRWCLSAGLKPEHEQSTFLQAGLRQTAPAGGLTNTCSTFGLLRDWFSQPTASVCCRRFS